MDDRERDSEHLHLISLTFFRDSIQFSDDDADGWLLLPLLAIGSMRLQQLPYTTLLIHMYRMEMIENLNKTEGYNSMVYAFHNPDQTSLRLHLDLAEQAAYLSFKSVLIYEIIKEGSKEAMNCFPLLLERGADVHFNVNDETPTTTAMRFSTWFSRQLVLLIRAGKGLKLFIVCNYPLDKTGWRVDTLGDLFALCRKTTTHLKAFQIPENDYYSCECCRSRKLRFAHVEPWWETLLRLVRTKQCLCRFLDTTWLVEGILVASNHGSSREIRCLDKWIFGLKHIRRRFRSRVDRDDFSTPRSDLGEDMTRPHICHCVGTVLRRLRVFA
ncbi:hypothetical protein M432DRAFT_142786 [Thermoascus aurantiacus ATCC 26904]